VRVLVTGSAGFIAGYLISELLRAGHHVCGIDNFSKYGPVVKEFDNHPNYEFVEGDCKDIEQLTHMLEGCDQVVAAAAMIGGITYFHRYAYDLLAENERILAATYDAALGAWSRGSLDRINVISSSMVFESTSTYPTPEGDERCSPPPKSSYGFQKLAAEYFARSAFDQYGLPFTILRPFNCVGVGEGRSLGDEQVESGNIQLAMSHVLPDLAQKVLKGQKPLRIFGDGAQIRHYTHGKDLGRGIRMCMETDKSINEDFNLSTRQSTTVLELAELVWREIHEDEPLSYESDEPFLYDVQKRVPDVSKAERILGFTAEIPIEQSVREVVAWVRQEIVHGRI